ncbi:MAG: DNA-3-methyladenine glycosylase [Ekhidna sp.]|nr:DNA-3-methyladenine glycosylase [Ekhidna sp.]
MHENNTFLYEKPDRLFFLREDVTQVAKDLLGMLLVSGKNGVVTAGKILETEAYCGRGDKACHANGKRTPRTEVMYREGGVAYIYLCYGIHHLINIVTNVEGQADAVLIRALEPVEGIEVMRERRNFTKAKLASGPGTLTQAMDIKVSQTGTDLLGDEIWIAKSYEKDFEISEGTRIGVDYAGEDAFRPWRFIIKGNKLVSRPVRSDKRKSPVTTSEFH